MSIAINGFIMRINNDAYLKRLQEFAAIITGAFGECFVTQRPCARPIGEELIKQLREILVVFMVC